MLVLRVESGSHNYNRIIFTAHTLGVWPACGRSQSSLIINGHAVTGICTVSVQQLACESPLKRSLHKYFKRALPSSEETGLGEATTRTVNRSVQRVLDGCEKSAKKPRKERTVYSDADRAAIGKYAAENGNTSAQKNFKEKLPELGESTVLGLSLMCSKNYPLFF